MSKNVKRTRFSYDENAVFSGKQIHRGRPIKFQLEGYTIEGYEGDTVLSALLGAGYNSVGNIHDEPLALTPGIGPHIVLTNAKGGGLTLPMARTPAKNGMKLSLYRSPDFSENEVSKPKLNFINSFLGKAKRSLDFNFETELTLPGPWLGQKSGKRLHYDLVIIGGGVAGLGAAQQAIEHGLHVALIEKNSSLGGNAYFFGATEGEQRPAEFIPQLVGEISKSKLVDVYLNTEATSIDNDHTKAHSISIQSGDISSENIDFIASKFILATGTLERLPIFPGNRLPGVISAREAFGLAAKFGVWQGDSAIICTNSSPATQVALLAADMGIKIKKLADSRNAPKSRFFEFAKAYGISLATGTQVHSASIDKDGQLSVHFCLTNAPEKFSGEPIQVDRLIVCGGWQPDLRLWHASGGDTLWNAATENLQATGDVEGVFLAGSCCGTQGMTACWNSGINAVSKLLDTETVAFTVPATNSAHESKDGKLPISPPQEDNNNCYLDIGHSLTQPSPKPPTGFWKTIFSRRKNAQTNYSQTTGETTLIDVTAKVLLNEIPAQFAGKFAQERCGIVADLQHTSHVEGIFSTFASEEKGNAPTYLKGRFGNKETVVRLKLAGNTMVEVGNFIFPDHAKSTPLEAIGSIVEIDKNDRSSALAVIDAAIDQARSLLIIRHGTGSTSATIRTE